MTRFSMIVFGMGIFEVYREPGLDHERGFWKIASKDVTITLNDDEAEELARRIRKNAKKKKKGQPCGASLDYGAVSISLTKEASLELADILEGKS